MNNYIFSIHRKIDKLNKNIGSESFLILYNTHDIPIIEFKLTHLNDDVYSIPTKQQS